MWLDAAAGYELRIVCDIRYEEDVYIPAPLYGCGHSGTLSWAYLKGTHIRRPIKVRSDRAER